MAKSAKKKSGRKKAVKKSAKKPTKKAAAKKVAMKKAAPKTSAKKASAKKAKPKKEKKFNPKSRLALIKGWKQRRLREQMKAEKRLSNYIERLVEKYPKDYMERIKAGLEDEDKFNEMVDELKFDMESSAAETDDEFLERFSRSLGVEDK